MSALFFPFVPPPVAAEGSGGGSAGETNAIAEKFRTFLDLETELLKDEDPWAVGKTAELWGPSALIVTFEKVASDALRVKGRADLFNADGTEFRPGIDIVAEGAAALSWATIGVDVDGLPTGGLKIRLQDAQDGVVFECFGSFPGFGSIHASANAVPTIHTPQTGQIVAVGSVAAGASQGIRGGYRWISDQGSSIAYQFGALTAGGIGGNTQNAGKRTFDDGVEATLMMAQAPASATSNSVAYIAGAYAGDGATSTTGQASSNTGSGRATEDDHRFAIYMEPVSSGGGGDLEARFLQVDFGGLARLSGRTNA